MQRLESNKKTTFYTCRRKRMNIMAAVCLNCSAKRLGYDDIKNPNENVEMNKPEFQKVLKGEQ